MISVEKLFKKETIAESAGIALFYTVIQRVLQTGRGIVFARLLGPSEYGAFTLAFFLIPLLAGIGRLGIPSSLTRYIPQYEKKGMLNDFINKTYFFALSASVVVMLICLLFSRQIADLIYNSPGYKVMIIVCAFSIFPTSLYQCVAQTLQGLRVFKLGYLMGFIQFLLFAIFGIVLVVIYRNGESAVVGNLISLIFAIAIFGLILMKYARRARDQIEKIRESGFYKKIFRYSIWFILSPIVFMLFRYTDRWMLNYFLGLEEVGIYSVAMNVTGLVFMFGIIVGNVLMPTLSFLWEEGNKEKALSILDFSIRSSTLLLLGGAVILMVFRNQIIGLLYGAEYARSSAIIGVLLIFWLLNTIYWIVGAYAGLIEKTYIPLASNAVGLACNIILNYIFIPKYGLMGAAAATTIAFEVTLVTIIVWSWIKGFCMSANTIFLCLIPLIFLLKDLVIIIIYLLLVGILFATELLMTKDERKKLFRHLFDAVRKYKGAG